MATIIIMMIKKYLAYMLYTSTEHCMQADIQVPLSVDRVLVLSRSLWSPRDQLPSLAPLPSTTQLPVRALSCRRLTEIYIPNNEWSQRNLASYPACLRKGCMGTRLRGTLSTLFKVIHRYSQCCEWLYHSSTRVFIAFTHLLIVS